MNQKDEPSWIEEFSEFSKSNVEGAKVPEEMSMAIKARLFPNAWRVFAKIGAVHAVVGFLSLAICNQFGLNPFNSKQTLTDWFMHVAGHNVCMLLCGAFFMSATYLLAGLFLTLEELEAIKRYEWLQTGVLGVISLAAFGFFGAELVGTFILLWVVGAFVGGYLSIEGTYRLRRVLSVY